MRRLPILLLLLAFLLTACQGPKVEITTIPAPTQTVVTAPTQLATAPPTTVEPTAETTEPGPDFSVEVCPDLKTVPIRLRQSFAHTGSPRMDAMAQSFLAFLESQGLSGAEISFIYEDLASMERMSYAGDQRYYAASVIKVPMAMVCRQLQAEGVFTDPMDLVYVPGEQFISVDVEEALLEQTVSLDSLLDKALLYSNNAATSVLFEFFKRHGRDLHFFLDERCGCHYAKDISMSAEEGIGFLESLYFNPEQVPGYQGILETMSQNSWNGFVKGHLGLPCASKYGQIGQENHEIGLVYHQRPFAYAIFSRGVDPASFMPALAAWLLGQH